MIRIVQQHLDDRTFLTTRLAARTFTAVSAACVAVLLLVTPSIAFEPMERYSRVTWIDDSSGLAFNEVRTVEFVTRDFLPLDESIEKASQQTMVGMMGTDFALSAKSEVIQPGAPEFAGIRAESEYRLTFRAGAATEYQLAGQVDVDFENFFFNDVASLAFTGPGVDVNQSFSPEADRDFAYQGDLPGGVYTLQLQANGAGAFDASWVEQLQGTLSLPDATATVPEEPPAIWEVLEVERFGRQEMGYLNRMRTTTTNSSGGPVEQATSVVNRQESTVSTRLINAAGEASDLTAVVRPVESSGFRLAGMLTGPGAVILERRGDCEDCWIPELTVEESLARPSFFGRPIDLTSTDDYRLRIEVDGPYDIQFLPVIPGDVTGDTFADFDDIDLLTSELAAGRIRPDLDQDGDFDLDQDDRRFWVEQIVGSTFGDANLDGLFDSSDLVQVFQAAEYEDDVVGNSTWASGDWDGDLEFQTDDLIFALQNSIYGAAAEGAMAVPEPSCAAFAWLSLCVILRRRRRMRSDRP